MPSKDPIQRFEDILENIILIEEVTRGMNIDCYLEDPKTRNATERCMERISEAARTLEETPKGFVQRFRGRTCALWNFLRHEYDRVDPGRVWFIIEDDLAPLKAATQRALENLRRAER